MEVEVDSWGTKKEHEKWDATSPVVVTGDDKENTCRTHKDGPSDTMKSEESLKNTV